MGLIKPQPRGVVSLGCAAFNRTGNAELVNQLLCPNSNLYMHLKKMNAFLLGKSQCFPNCVICCTYFQAAPVQLRGTKDHGGNKGEELVCGIRTGKEKARVHMAGLHR